MTSDAAIAGHGSLPIEVDDALELSDQIELQGGGGSESGRSRRQLAVDGGRDQPDRLDT